MTNNRKIMNSSVYGGMTQSSLHRQETSDVVEYDKAPVATLMHETIRTARHDYDNGVHGNRHSRRKHKTAVKTNSRAKHEGHV